MKNCLRGVNESEWFVSGVNKNNFYTSKYTTHSSSIFLCKAKSQKAKIIWFLFLKKATCSDWPVGYGLA